MAFSEVVGSLNSTKKLINLLRGWPNTSLLPNHLLDRASHNALSNKAVAFSGMLYGPDAGDTRLRKNVASWLTNFYQPPKPIPLERITITGGASQNLACLLQVFTDPVYTRNVWIVSPSYMLAFRIFDDSGFHRKLRAVPEDDEGIDIDFLKKEIRRSEDRARADGNNEPQMKPDRPWGKVYRHVIYAVPTFSNPSFKTMTLRRREELVRVAREYDALIITDDVYDFLQWPSSLKAQTLSLDKAVLPRVVDVDRYLDGGAERDGADGFGNAASNGSFSKICGPGLRTGWVEGTEKLAYGVSQTGSSRSGGAPSQLTATFVAETLESGELQRYVLETLQPAYGSRYRTMIAAINKELIPLGVRLPQMDRDVVGGYFIWLTLPPPLKGTVVAQRAKDEENLVVAQGEIFEVPGDTEHAHFENDLRVCFAWEQEEKLAEGIERLARVIRSMQNDKGGNDQTMQHATGEGAKDFW
ncbi:PLP-dependent transferase [Zopfia rhizophila CBS 207.26]|uniref:PLP-dependent transferase n=1 Tax=Zopfia rhizophila CBS 207.26 TaxID=1314779 RepID=A0A6A6EUN9_9PEZI|nr:PLP-dependent transferase [Zopfia rhizophila CBS 207.26]